MKDSSDYVTRAIHEFYQARISEDDKEFGFLSHWLKEFEVGDSLDVIAMKGEAYQVLVYDKDNKKGIDLADKGMGSIQMTILLLRIATLIRMYKGANLTIILEEPEQNMHPALQSKLAELINQVNIQFGVRFVVETHSEYLVRHTQVLAAKKMYEEGYDLENVNQNIKVYYISQERGVIDMLFMDNAKFQDNFDEGFFDQAARESLTISRMERIFKNK